MVNTLELPDDLPVPEDDGGAAHLEGAALPDIAITATSGDLVLLSQLSGRTVIYIYPRTGRPDEPLPDGWDMIPGARGCTPQSCAFRDHFADLQTLGVAALYGLSTQDSAYQREAKQRLHLPFEMLSDSDFKLGDSLRLPDFETSGMRLYKRLTMIVDDGVISKVFYPVFPPDRSAEDVIGWLKG